MKREPLDSPALVIVVIMAFVGHTMLYFDAVIRIWLIVAASVGW